MYTATKNLICVIPLLGIARMMISQPCNQDSAFFFIVHCNKNPIYVFLFWELHGLPGEVVEPGTAHDLQPCNQDFFYVHWNENPIYVFLFWELHGLPGEVMEPGTVHDLQPCNQDSVFFLSTLQQKSHLFIPLLGIARAARRGRGTRYRA
jgi:hypothetical protein